MQTAFQAKNKLDFIEGKVQQPAEGEAYHEQWVICNSMLVSWIFNHLEEELQNSVVGAKNAKVLWDYLTEQVTSSLGDDPSATIANEMGTIEPPATSFMDIQPLISRINAVRKPIRRGSLVLEENLGLLLPLFHNSIRAMRDSVSDMGNRDNLEASTRAAHLRHVRPSLLVGNGGPISQPNTSSLTVQQVTWQPKLRPMETSPQISAD
ncbi:hypothetical protein CRG98_041876 [Punica granatum]|uniref:Retrotransposon Copia-like N-terminal domain-containing protein n=1 Tax=Punica granatum TaxID=22663 RepID=A0A2I0I186_PUNGR|nr:hypothetical protein CRG98_041876 [Punica granatum]